MAPAAKIWGTLHYEEATAYTAHKARVSAKFNGVSVPSVKFDAAKISPEVTAVGDQIRELKAKLKGEGVSHKKVDKHPEVVELVAKLTELKERDVTRVTAVGDQIRELKAKLKGEGVSNKKVDKHPEVVELVAKLTELKEAATAAPAAAPAEPAAAAPAALADGPAQVKAIADQIKALKEKLKADGSTGSKLNEHPEIEAYNKCKRNDPEHDDWDVGSPCGDLADSSGEESTTDGDSFAGGGRDSDSSSGELSTVDDDLPTGGERDRVTSSSGGGSAADDVSPKEGCRRSQTGTTPIAATAISAPLTTSHRQEAAPLMTFHHTKASAAAFAAATAKAAPPMTFHHTKASATALSTSAAEAAQPMDDASPKENLKEPQGIPVAYQAANQVSKGTNHERGGSSPVQAAIRSAIAASADQRARPAGSAVVNAEMLVPALASVLGHLVALGCRKQRVTIFHAKWVPQVSLVDYLRRIAAYYPCADQGLVLGLIYLDRLLVKHPDFVVSGLSVHRLLATAMTLSSKFLNDISYRNEHYAKVAGMQAQELSFLEAHFLKLLDWRLNVSAEDFEQYQTSIMAAYPRGLIAHGPAAPQVKRE